MRVLDLRIRGVVSNRSDTSGLLREPGDAVLVDRGRPRLLVLRCPDNCGEELAINVDRKVGKAWRLYNANKSLTVFPSIWRDTGCESHFIISRGRVFLFGDRDEDEGDDLWNEVFGPSSEEVLGALSMTEPESPDTIGDRIGALPWDVLRICRGLVRERRAVEGSGQKRGMFRRL